MSDKLTTTWDTDKSLYAILTNAAGQAINGTTPETPVEANRGAYAIALAEQDLKQVYEATFPAVAAGVYSVSLWEQQGVSPASTDLWIGGGEVQWGGANLAVLGTSGNAATLGGAIDVAVAEANAAHNIVADGTFGNQAIESEVAAVKATTDGLVQTDGKLWVLDDQGNPLVKAGDAMTLDLTQPVPTTNTDQTVGDALNAARAQGFGRWSISGTTLTLYAPDGTTPVHTFTLDSATVPTSRT